MAATRRRILIFLIAAAWVAVLTASLWLPEKRAEIFLKYVQTLAWPTAVVGLIVLLRHHLPGTIQDLSQRLRSAELPLGIRLELDSAQRAMAEADAAVASPAFDARQGAYMPPPPRTTASAYSPTPAQEGAGIPPSYATPPAATPAAPPQGAGSENEPQAWYPQTPPPTTDIPEPPALQDYDEAEPAQQPFTTAPITAPPFPFEGTTPSWNTGPTNWAANQAQPPTLTWRALTPIPPTFEDLPQQNSEEGVSAWALTTAYDRLYSYLRDVARNVDARSATTVSGYALLLAEHATPKDNDGWLALARGMAALERVRKLSAAEQLDASARNEYLSILRKAARTASQLAFTLPVGAAY